MPIVFLAFAAFTLIRWLVRTRTFTAPTAALLLACVVAALRVAAGGSPVAALISGAIAGAAVWLLTWLDDRFHSLATIPIWLVSSALVLVILVLALT